MDFYLSLYETEIIILVFYPRMQKTQLSHSKELFSTGEKNEQRS